MKTDRLRESDHQVITTLVHDGLPEGWRSALLAGLPHGLLAILSLILTLVSPLQQGDKATSNIEIFYLAVTLMMGLILVVFVLIAWRQNWPRWSGSYYLYAFIAAAAPVLFLLQTLDTQLAYRWMDILLTLVLILILVLWSLVVVLRDPVKGLLMLAPVSILSWWLVLEEFVPNTIRNPLQTGMFVIATLVAVWIARKGNWRQGMWVLVVASLLVGLPGVYFRTYHHTIPAVYTTEPSVLAMLEMYAKAAFWSVLLVIGPILVWVLRELGMRDENGGGLGYRLTLWGLVLSLVFNLAVDRSYGLGWLSRHPGREVLSWISILGSALVFLVGLILTLRSACKTGALSQVRGWLLGITSASLPLMLMLPMFDSRRLLSTSLPFGLIYENQVPDLGVYGVGLVWLLVAGWLITRQGWVDKEMNSYLSRIAKLQTPRGHAPKG